MSALRKYGAAATLLCPMIKAGAIDFAVSGDWTPATGDVKVSKDDGAFANITTLPTAVGNMWLFSLSATEMQAARVVIQVVDSATKAVEDQSIAIETYGHASAQHAMDFDDAVRAGLTALPNAAADAAGGLPISDAGGLDLDTLLARLDAAISSRLAPTTSGRTLDVTTGGCAGIDWANVEAPTTSVALTGTQISSSQVIGSVTGAVGSVTGSVGSVLGGINTFAGTITTLDALDTAQDAQHAATQAAVGAIGVASGSGLAFEAEADNTGGAIKSVTFVGTQASGTFASTEAEDGVYHQITDTANAIDIVYQFDVTDIRKASQAVWKGYVNGGNDTITVQAYDYVGADWETRRTISGQAGSSNVTVNIPLLSKHTGTVADSGKVLIRFVCTGQSTPSLFTDSLLVEASLATQSVGYAMGALWLDTSASNTGTVPFVDGVADNPVSTIGAALTLGASLGLKRLVCANGSSFTLSAAFENWIASGHEWTIALGGQSVADTMFIDANVSGIATGNASEWEDCQFGNVTIPPSQYYRCTFSGTFTVGGAGDYLFLDCCSQVAGTGTPIFDFAGVGATTMSIRRWSGGIRLDNLAAGDVVTLEGIFGAITLNGADATVEIRGIYKSLINNLTGSPSVTAIGVKGTDLADVLTDTTALTDTGVNVYQIVGNSVAAINLKYSLLAMASGSVAVSGSNTATSFQIDGNINTKADDYWGNGNGGAVLVFIEGTANEYQARRVVSFNTTTNVITVEEAFDSTPANADVFVILGRITELT